MVETRLIYAVAHDVSDRKQLEAALHSANRELEQRVAERTLQWQQADAALSECEVIRTNVVVQRLSSASELRTPYEKRNH